MWFDVHDWYTPGRVTKDSAVPNPGVPQPAATLPTLKADDGTVPPDTRASPPIDRSQKRSEAKRI